ncbi:MAG: hypothetical protein C0484_08050 [Rhodospirillum sp.]|jgi:hypothetical protein|nr:hypothetical protein [Rhodospirillum sp.]
MARALIIAVAVLLGAASVWFLVPTVPLAKVTAVQTSSNLPTSKEIVGKPVRPGGPMSAEKRHARAEQLIGEPFKYISKDEVHSKGWFTEHGVQVIERAMDECYLMGEGDLFWQHVKETADSDLLEMDEEEQVAHFKAVRPTFTQLHNCTNAKRAYDALFEAQG